MFLPVLKLQSNLTEFKIFWSDEVAIRIGRNSYCIKCGKISLLNVCLSCKETINYKKFSCQFTKAGMPFGISCVKEKIPCEDLTYAENICFKDYIIYIGKKGNYWKVGISREKRNGIKDGFLLRLIEQGLEDVIVISSNNQLNLLEAQKLEEKISEELSIPQKLTEYKDKDLNLENIVSHLTSIHKDIRPEIISNLTKAAMFSPWLPFIEAKKLFHTTIIKPIKGGEILNGKILASWGKESLIKANKDVYRINRNELIGKRIIPLQEENWGE